MQRAADPSHDDAAASPRREWRIGAYAICRRNDDVLVVRASSRTQVPGRWFLPGGGLGFGEEPSAAALRELTEETGLTGRAPRLVCALSEVHRRISDDEVFSIRLVYGVDVADGELVHERDGTSDEARWVPRGELAALGAMPYVLRALELSEK
jgi:8-oxo-dGTP pyrophosphatase MutT (NUDIX family)